jgi:DNA-binding transcriptional LysR family regulator
MRGLTIRQLQVFVCAARHLSFARAAEELHLTQPAISMQVKELESAVGLPLFDRGGRRISLTTPGEYFLVHARRMLAALKDADDTMARMKGVQSGRLTVGIVSTAKYFVPRLLAEFRREHPAIELRLEVGNRQALVGQLKDNEVDLAIMGTPPRELDTRAEPFATNPLVMIAAPEHPLARLSQVPAALLGNEVFLVREPGSGTRASMEIFLKERRIHPATMVEMPSNETIKQAVMADMGVSILSIHTIGLELSAGVIRMLEVEGLPLLRRWHVVNMRAKLLSPAAEAFRYFILEQAQAVLQKPPFGATLPGDGAPDARPGASPVDFDQARHE